MVTTRSSSSNTPIKFEHPIGEINSHAHRCSSVFQHRIYGLSSLISSFPHHPSLELRPWQIRNKTYRDEERYTSAFICAMHDTITESVVLVADQRKSNESQLVTVIANDTITHVQNVSNEHAQILRRSEFYQSYGFTSTHVEDDQTTLSNVRVI